MDLEKPSLCKIDSGHDYLLELEDKLSSNEENDVTSGLIDILVINYHHYFWYDHLISYDIKMKIYARVGTNQLSLS